MRNISMAIKIQVGRTELSDLYKVFGFKSNEEFERKRARLFPSGNMDNEVAATSVFLASLSAIKEYREELLAGLQIDKIKNRKFDVHTYTELKLKNNDRPDGLIVITSGKTAPIIEWVGFVEAKVGTKNKLKPAQIKKYASDAREIEIRNLITISNRLASTPVQSPIKIAQTSFNLYHWSWVYLKVMGSRLIKTNQEKKLKMDSDHLFILNELIRYFNTHKNMFHYEKMGNDWENSVKKIRPYSESQKVEKSLLENISKSYAQEEKDIALHLTEDSGLLVELLVKKDRLTEIEKMLTAKKIVTSTFIIDKSRTNMFTVEVDFIRREISCKTIIELKSGKAIKQSSDLIKLFDGPTATPDLIMIQAFYPRNRTNNKCISLSKLVDAKEQREPYSILDKNIGDTVKYFQISTKDSLGGKFQNEKHFVTNLESIADKFLTQIMQIK
jgi:hypothetical protein